MNESQSTAQALVQQTGRLQTLSEISRVVSATLDLLTLYDTIYDQIGRVMDTTQFFIALHQEDQDTLEIAYQRENGELTLDREVPYARSVTTIVIERGEPVLFRNLADYQLFAAANGVPDITIGDSGSEAMIFMPLNTGSRTIGAISVQSMRQSAYSEDDVQTLSIIASQAAVAIENARLFSEQRDRVYELQTIQSIVQKITPLHDMPAIATLIDQELRQLIDYHACRLLFLDTQEQVLLPIGSTSEELRLRVGEGVAGWIALHGRPINIANTLLDKRMKQIPGTPVREESMIGAPLNYEGRVQGVITLSRLGVNQFDGNALRLLEIIAGQTAIAFDRARLYAQLRTDAVTDPLTKLYNRRYLIEHFQEEKARAIRNGHTLTAIVLDVDKFKQINDQFGHEAGDLVLQELAGVIRHAVRAEDLVTRFGGEEFCILVPEVSPDVAEHMAERLRSLIQDHEWSGDIGMQSVSVSVGLAFLQPDDDEHELFSRADRAMYEVKQRGGNGVGSWHTGAFHVPGRSDHVELYIVGNADPASQQTLIDDATRVREQLRTVSLFSEEVINSVQQGIIVLDDNLRYVLWNPFMEQLVGMTADEVMGKSALDLFPDLGEAGIDSLFRRALSGETVACEDRTYSIPATGRSGWVTGTYAPRRDAHGRITGVIGVITDVTERRQAQEALTRQALRDSLTDLPNRRQLRNDLTEAIAASRQGGSSLALLFLDLNRFKEVNDTFGHEYGDAFLRQLALRLQQTVRPSDTVARLGGDEFALLLTGVDAANAGLMADKILRVLEEPFLIEGHTFDVGANIGISVHPDHGDDATTLMQRADFAMYVAKRSGSVYVMYDPEHVPSDPRRLTLVSELRHAIDGDQLLLHYQPEVDLRSGSAEHVEALVRWQHPERGFMPPGDFIPLAEETGLIKPLTAWVLNEAVRQAVVWRDGGLDIRVAVNLSARSLHQSDLVSMVTEALRKWDLDPSGLQLEITESAIIVNPEQALRTLTRLHDMGVSIAIDDFGTGYSSLAHLTRLPIDQIKIDRSFVMDMRAQEENAFIVRSIIDLSRNLGLLVVAEGVENQSTLSRLSMMGCNLAQGYFLSRPLPADDILRWFSEQSGPSNRAV